MNSKSKNEKYLNVVLSLISSGLFIKILLKKSALNSYLFSSLYINDQILQKMDVGILLFVALSLLFQYTDKAKFSYVFLGGLFFSEALFSVLSGGKFLSELSLGAQAIRFLIPIALLISAQKLKFNLLRIGIGVTFVVHGIEAALSHPHFIDLILNFQTSFFNYFSSEATVKNLLSMIGLFDVTIGVLCLLRPSRKVFMMMALWGGITALSRVFTQGEMLALSSVLIRAAHFLIPLILLQINIDQFKMNINLKRFAHILPVLLIFLTGQIWADQNKTNTFVVDGLRLVFDENPSDSVKIIFSQESKSRIQIGMGLKRVMDADQSSYDKVFKLSKPQKFGWSSTYVSTLVIKGLKAGERYYFRLYSGGKSSREFYFEAPDPEQEFKLLFGGDSRSDRVHRRKMNQLIAKIFTEQPDIVALVHGGDFINNGRSTSEWKDWFKDYQLTTTAQGRVLPIIPTRGNHERSETLFNEAFATPGGVGNYYVTKLGPLHLFTLNTEISCAGQQRLWLEKELNNSSTEATWLIGNYHTPAYPAVKQPSCAKKSWVPLFDRFHFDLVFESDGHTLKKTLPILNDRPHENGVVYVGEGGLGVKQRTPDTSRWYLQSPGYATSSHHVQVLTVNSVELNYEVITIDGDVFDNSNFAKKNRDHVGRLPSGSFAIKYNPAQTCLTQIGNYSYQGFCRITPRQTFRVEKTRRGLQIKSLRSGKCLGTYFFGVKFKDCDSKKTYWTNENGQLRNTYTGKCLYVRSSGREYKGLRYHRMGRKSCSKTSSDAFELLTEL